MKSSRNTTGTRGSLSDGPSFSGSLVAVGVGVLATVVAGICCTAVLLLVDALRGASPPHALLVGFGYASVLIGGGYAANRCGRRGWAHGAAVAVVSFGLVVLAVQGTAGFSALADGSGIRALALLVLTGTAGGIFGLTLKRR